MIWLSLLGTAFGASVVINEAMVNPYGSDAGREWVELYNASDAPVSLTGWDLRWALSSSTTGEHELASVVLEPGEFYVISGELVGGGDELAELSFGNASSNADIIQLQMEQEQAGGPGVRRTTADDDGGRTAGRGNGRRRGGGNQ